MLYIADEIFFSGTAAEVTPIRSVDRIVVGNGRRGPITEQIQKRFFDVVNGRIPDEFRWLTFVAGVPTPEPVTAESIFASQGSNPEARPGSPTAERSVRRRMGLGHLSLRACALARR